MNIKEAFEEFWSVKPRRKGANPKDQARLKFSRAVANGADPQKIVGAARAWTKAEAENGKLGTEYVAMAVTWLNQNRFNDYEPVGPDRIAEWDAIAAKHGYVWGEVNGVPQYVKAENGEDQTGA